MPRMWDVVVRPLGKGLRELVELVAHGLIEANEFGNTFFLGA